MHTLQPKLKILPSGSEHSADGVRGTARCGTYLYNMYNIVFL